MKVQSKVPSKRHVDACGAANAVNPNPGKKFRLGSALHFASLFWEDIDTPTSLGLFLCAKYKDIKEIVRHEVSPRDYEDVDDFAVDWQACKLLSKVCTPVSGLSPRDTAISEFFRCEQVCRNENEFWRKYDTSRLELTPYMDKILRRAQSTIADILGEFEADEMLENARFGPGTADGIPDSQNVFTKLSSKLTVSPALLPLTNTLMKNYEGWLDGLTYSNSSKLRVEVLVGGKHSLVPKSAKTDRNIEIQPLLNVFLQLGLGQCIRERLMKVGIDLSDQSRNQEYAKQGSVGRGFSTIDMTSASDMISSGVVCALLPPRWISAMKKLRTDCIRGKSLGLKPLETLPLERFSSMGNGFTFEVETLIFYALARSVVGEGVVSVYGDDVIVPDSKFGEVCTVLRMFGFQPNERKSYSADSCFRESCGGDFFRGVNVRPYFLKELPTDETEIIQLVNGFARCALRRDRGYDFDARYLRAIHYARSHLNPRLASRLAVGRSSDDTYLLGSRERKGLRLLKKSPHPFAGSYYAAKSVMLYRLHLASAIDEKKRFLDNHGARHLSSDKPQPGYRTESFDPLIHRWIFGSEPDEPGTCVGDDTLTHD